MVPYLEFMLVLEYFLILADVESNKDYLIPSCVSGCKKSDQGSETRSQRNKTSDLMQLEIYGLVII